VLDVGDELHAAAASFRDIGQTEALVEAVFPNQISERAERSAISRAAFWTSTLFHMVDVSNEHGRVFQPVFRDEKNKISLTVKARADGCDFPFAASAISALQSSKGHPF
jgi:hypothetical protein